MFNFLEFNILIGGELSILFCNELEIWRNVYVFYTRFEEMKEKCFDSYWFSTTSVISGVYSSLYTFKNIWTVNTFLKSKKDNLKFLLDFFYLPCLGKEPC